MMKKTRRGFTLIEILIVVVILGILAALIVPNVASTAQEASASAAYSQLTAVRGQIEMYKLRSGGVVPGVAGTDGTDELFLALTSPIGAAPALLQKAPTLPLGFTWDWDGARLSVSYTGADAELVAAAAGW
jgi:prepilin-type N-terminal cleavage/methylation domain-containing protein